MRSSRAPRPLSPTGIDATANQPKASPAVATAMAAVSIRQPTANAVMARAEPFELPGWLTDYRGPLLIHASRREGGDPPVDASAGAAYGALIGVVEMVDCVSRDREGGGPDETAYVWVLADPRPFARPIPYAGRMGLFQVAGAAVADALTALGQAGQHRPRRRKAE